MVTDSDASQLTRTTVAPGVVPSRSVPRINHWGHGRANSGCSAAPANWHTACSEPELEPDSGSDSDSGNSM